jgi:hypothetical protein
MRLIEIDLKWAVAVIVAAYGAGLSSYNTYIARKQSQHQIAVKVTFGWLTNGPNLSEDMLMVEASNPGHRAITLTSVGFLLRDGRQLALLDPQGSKSLPHHLAEGTNIMHWIPMREMSDTLHKNGLTGKVKLRGFYKDAVGATHQSERASFNC